MTEIARGAGVASISQWNRDRKSAAVLEEVKRQTAEAQRLGFGGTPSFGVEGPGTEGLKALDFPESAGDLEEAIEEAQAPRDRRSA
jgi:protein-disulfide isomerase